MERGAAMKPTYPVREFPWRLYLIPAAFCIAASVVSLAIYDRLPERLATHFDFEGKPNGWTAKGPYVAMMLGIMWAMLLFFALLDRFLVYRTLPTPLMSSITGATELFFLLIHLGILRILNVQTSPPLTIVGFVAAMCAYIVAHCWLFRSGPGERSTAEPLWIDRPPHGLLDTILFFIRPILPNEIRAYDEGLVVNAALYSIAIPWDTIEEAAKATRAEAMGGMAVRVASNSSHAVKLKLKDARLPLIFSVEEEARLINEWKERRTGAPQ